MIGLGLHVDFILKASCNLVFGQMPDKKLFKILLKECVDLSNGEVTEIIKYASSLSEYPYIYLSNRFMKNHPESKIRFDIFNNNLILMKKFA